MSVAATNPAREEADKTQRPERPASGSGSGPGAKVILGTTMSVDGFINDRNGDLGRLYPDLAALRETRWLQEEIRTTGAVVMGRHAYDLANGDFTGYEFQVPIFVLTHNKPEHVAKAENGNLSFTFVGDGIESAIEKAKAVAGAKNVQVIGGANTAQQLIRAGLLDELQIGIVPVLLGDGLRFFEHLGGVQADLELLEIIESPGRVDLRFGVLK
jgi:dihydrofolate reductase